MANHAAHPSSIIGSQYCTPHQVDLAVTNKTRTIKDGDFVVTDVNENILFKVKGSMFDLHDTHVLLDSANNPIVSMRHKILSAHSRWEVYKGHSSNHTDMLFSVRKSSVIQFNTKLDVFLASNTHEKVCDFKIKGSWFEHSCVIYHGETSNIAAEMHNKRSAHTIDLGKDKLMVTIHPNVDHAFIIALIVILSEINQEQDMEPVNV